MPNRVLTDEQIIEALDLRADPRTRTSTVCEFRKKEMADARRIEALTIERMDRRRVCGRCRSEFQPERLGCETSSHFYVSGVRYHGQLVRQETSEGAEDGMAGGSRDASGTVPAAVHTTVSDGPPPSDPPSQDEAEVERLLDAIQEAICAATGDVDPRSWPEAKKQAKECMSHVLALASLARRLIKERDERVPAHLHNQDVRQLVNERDEARRLHDEHCGGKNCHWTEKWRPR